ncbi:GH92 family glycosyl hydrolase [Saccharothrix longispora]|uniref:Alpha-1,2-mannosidase n=1 Tax=Saccharothrix longispora TaxID=33920 RepID=A0ABU1PP44_9PSEU|nr:GH92 family glycosyl hydrolase [Saccharothrix longispora]MDR6592221.1 putative alpha-1,2-mannosidase [Saccharothrix longispora]
MRLRSAAVAALTLTALATPITGTGAAPAPSATDPAQHVNAFVGTKPGGPDFGHGGGGGNTFPGAVAPFGMLQWSPDTVTHQHGGYHYDDNRIRGFSLTHLSGPGCSDFGNVPFMPSLGTAPVAHSTFSHANEQASPGYYSVRFDNGIRTELTSNQRSGVARFTYPAGQRASLAVDAARAFNAASGSITVGTDSLSGYTDSGGFCGAGNRYRLHFHVAFDRPFAGAATVLDGQVREDLAVEGDSGTPSPPAPKTAQTQGVPAPSATSEDVRPLAAAAFVSFDATTVTARVGISFVSLDGAKANLAAETGTRSFDEVRTAARAAWNGWLGRIDVTGGTTTQLRTLYTSLYHSLLHPNVFSDVTGQYTGFDRQVHTTTRTQYANFSGWDVYRSQVALIALLAPREAADIAQSAVNQAAQGGYFDRWTVANGGTGVMNGDPMAIVVSTAHAFGGTGFDTADALRRVVAGVDDVRQRPGWLQFDGYGYVPTGLPDVWGSAATTLEYTSADFAISQFAARLGDAATAERFLRRAQNWRNLFESGGKYLKPRNTDLSWPSFNPVQENEYVEGNAAQYTWMVPYNHRGLFDAMGGDAAVVSRLDTFFTELNAGPKKPYAYLGNEPTLNTPWAYAYAGAPHKAQDVVRRALTSIFTPVPEGLVGNDDLGQMSSWAVWAVLGLYPQAPGRADLVVASPQFPSTTVRRGNGATITITAPQASDANRYVQSLRVNGAASTRPWLPASFVAQGGALDFTLGATASTWGSAPADAPPSFDVGPVPARSGAVGGLSSKCLDAEPAGPTDGAPVRLWDCNASAAQQWTLAPDGTLRALGRCLDVSGSSRANGAKVQLWTCNGTGAQQWWPKGGTLVSPASGKCLDVPNSDPANGVQLQLYTCNTSTAQQWRVP